MSDADLEEIRKGRLAQLQQQQQQQSGGGAAADGEDEQRRQEAEARASILSQILQPEAADRLGRIRLVKESRAADVENHLLVLARSGQLQAKVTEEQLKELLGAVAQKNEYNGTANGKIIVSRRKGGWIDDDDDDDLPCT
ncbi:MAG: hypothetical protein Q9219_001117 [cf. Caloplaca sp. 3 TL-2023]